MIAVDKVMAITDLGLEGDRRCMATQASARQVTLINQQD